MPKGNKSLVATVTVRGNPSQKQKKKKNRTRKGSKSHGATATIARLIADPCGPVLTPGQYGTVEGFATRTHFTFQLAPAGTASCGFILWDPERTPAPYDVQGKTASGTDYYEANVFVFCKDNSSTSIPNSMALPFGADSEASFFAGTPMTTAGRIKDPATNFGDNTLVQDMRTLSACLRMTPTGKAMDTSGQYCLIEGITSGALFPLAGAGPNTGPAIDQLFSYASSVHAFTKDGVELRWRPTETSGIFRTKDDGTLHVPIANVANDVSGPSETSEAQGARFMGIAWRGVDTTVGHPFVFDLIKNVEARVSPFVNTAHAPPVRVSEQPIVTKAVDYLDRRVPNWATAQSKSLSQTISDMAFGAAGVAVKHGAGALRDWFSGVGSPTGPFTALGAL